MAVAFPSVATLLSVIATVKRLLSIGAVFVPNAQVKAILAVIDGALGAPWMPDLVKLIVDIAAGSVTLAEDDLQALLTNFFRSWTSQHPAA